MRSGLLAAGLILLVLGAIFYFVPGASADTVTTDDQSVRTETYATAGEVETTTTSDTTDTTTSGNGGFFETTTVADPEPTVTTTEDRGFFVADGDDDSTVTSSTATGPAAGGDLQRQLAVLAMILGAILTILGLVLPDPEPASNVQVNTTARTAGAAGRRVTYEREEDHEVHRRL